MMRHGGRPVPLRPVYDVPPPPPTLAAQPPKKGGGGRLALIMTAVIAGVVVLLGGTAFLAYQKISADPGDDIPQPHRAAVKAARPAAGEPSWTAPDHHWVGLSNVWSQDHGSLFSFKFEQRGLVSDGKRAIEFRDGRATAASSTAMITSFDGTSGKQLWQTRLPWAHSASPTAGNGVVIVPSGEESGYDDRSPLTYVALDTATGKERWRVQVAARTIASDLSPDHARPQPGGALLNGVFYYGDGDGVIGVDARTGKRRYAFTSKKYTTESAPIAVGGRIAMLAGPSGDRYSQTHEAHVFPADLKTYTKFRFSESAHRAPQQFAANGDVLVAWNDEDLSTTDVRTGKRLAHVRLGLSSDYGGMVGRTLLVQHRQGVNDRVVGYDLLTGRQRWSVDPLPDDYSFGMLDVADGTALVAGDDLSLIDPATGKTVFTRKTPYSITGGLATLAGGHLVVSFDKGIAGYR